MPSLPQFIADVTMSPGLWLCAPSRVIAPLMTTSQPAMAIRKRIVFGILQFVFLLGFFRYWPGKHRLLQGWHALLCDDCQKTEPAGERSHSACEWSKPGSQLTVVCVFERQLLNLVLSLCSRHKGTHRLTESEVCPSLAFLSLSFILPVFYSLSVFAQYWRNGLTKPTVFRNKLPTQAHLLSVCVLTIHGSFLSLATFHRKQERPFYMSVFMCKYNWRCALFMW